MKRFIVEIDTADPRDGMVTPGMLGDAISDTLDDASISYGAVRVKRIDETIDWEAAARHLAVWLVDDTDESAIGCSTDEVLEAAHRLAATEES